MTTLALSPKARSQMVLRAVLAPILMIGLLVPGGMTPVHVILAVLGAVTALQRGWSALVRA